MKTKLCCDCKKEKIISEFWNNKLKKDGLMDDCKKCHTIRRRNYQIKHSEERKQYSKDFQKKNMQDWEEHFPKSMVCEICERPVFFNKKNKRDSVHFDHPNLESRKIIRTQPGIWLRNNPCTSKNIKIWASCNFGKLCLNCNSFLPTKDREQFLLKATSYCLSKKAQK